MDCLENALPGEASSRTTNNSNVEDHLLRMRIVNRFITATTSNQIDVVRRMIEERVTYSEIYATIGMGMTPIR